MYQALWAEPGDFDEVLISPVMIQDHMPDNMLEALNKVSPQLIGNSEKTLKSKRTQESRGFLSINSDYETLEDIPIDSDNSFQQRLTNQNIRYIDCSNDAVNSTAFDNDAVVVDVEVYGKYKQLPS